jgi:hypothetical protein
MQETRWRTWAHAAQTHAERAVHKKNRPAKVSALAASGHFAEKYKKIV